MQYSYILDIITRNIGAHRFIDFKDCSEYQNIMNQLLNEYGTFNKNNPSAIYFDNYSITDNSMTQLSIEQQNRKLKVLSDYYRHLIAVNLVKHLNNNSIDIEKALLTTFRFGEKPKTTMDLIEKLEFDLIELRKSYQNYDQNNQIYWPMIKFLGFDSLFINIESYTGFKWFCNLYFNASNIDKDTATILNDYISSRIGSLLCFNICYDSSNRYPTNVDRSGILVQTPHDYQVVKVI